MGGNMRLKIIALVVVGGLLGGCGQQQATPTASPDTGGETTQTQTTDKDITQAQKAVENLLNLVKKAEGNSMYIAAAKAYMTATARKSIAQEQDALAAIKTFAKVPGGSGWSYQVTETTKKGTDAEITVSFRGGETATYTVKDVDGWQVEAAR